MQKSQLFSPVQVGGNEFKNRIFVSPMCQYSADNGLANDWHLVHIGSFALGGAALVMMEATAVCPEGRITPGCLGLWSPDHADRLRPIVKFVREHNAKIGIQLAHAGRKASHALPWKGGKSLPKNEGAWTTFAPSPLAYDLGETVPAELSLDQMTTIKNQFVQSAKWAVELNYDVVELHFAHGYLMHEFLSPLSNHRSDHYGGNAEGRMRWPLELARAVRKVVPKNKSMFIRISATDWVEGGWDIEQSVTLSRHLRELGVDLIDASSGGLSPLQKIPNAPLYQVPFAEKIKKEAGIKTGAVGLITEARQAEQIILENKADVVSLAREMLRDPHWPLRAAHEIGSQIAWPVQYDRAQWK